jgi:hypothetical protein
MNRPLRNRDFGVRSTSRWDLLEEFQINRKILLDRWRPWRRKTATNCHCVFFPWRVSDALRPGPFRWMAALGKVISAVGSGRQVFESLL